MAQTAVYFTHLLSLVIWIGGVVFFSFIAAPAVFKTLDRPQAGEVVGVIFPRYYLMAYVCAALAAVTLLASRPGMAEGRLPVLAAMALCSLVSGLFIGPRARAIKAHIHAGGAPERIELLKKSFEQWHAWSVRLNGAVLLLGLALLWLTAARFAA